MRYGYFDNESREYVIEKIDVPVSWTNYLGVKDMCGVINHTAGGYLFYKSPEYHRITRFRPNGVPMDRPGFYVYLRDDVTGEYWSISWQPVGLPLNQAKYECRHGLSYSTFSCNYQGLVATQKIFIPINDPVMLWEVKIKNTEERTREISVFSYLEFSFHHIAMDNQNHQMSLYASGSHYEEGIIEYDLFYEEFGYQYFTSNFTPDGFDCMRDAFIGGYRTETNPIAVERGKCSESAEKGGNHCGSLHKKLSLNPGEEIRLLFMLGEGDKNEGKIMRSKYMNESAVDDAFLALRNFWEKKLSRLSVNTPNEAMNTMINVWNLYQSEINVMFSRFASFIEVGGRVGLGYRDTAQDAMTIPHSNPQKCRQRIIELLRGLVSEGYGLHLFQPEWFEPKAEIQSFQSPTVVPTPNTRDMIHGLDDACSDDALWLIGAIVEYIRETGELSLIDEIVPYADGGEGTVYEHMKKILNFSAEQTGKNGIAKGLRADWNDCLNLGGGESAMVSFLHYWALQHFIHLCTYTDKKEDAQIYRKMADKVQKDCEEVLWDGNWYIRGITSEGKPIGTSKDEEGKIHLESNVWAVLSGTASQERGIKSMDSVGKWLFTKYGIMLHAPSYTKPDDSIGFVTRVYPGVKENGAIFSHPNPWAWAAEAVLGRGSRAMKYYDALCPYNQNDIIEIRQSEPYSYCQFIMGKDHTAFGRARHPFMTGSAGWSYYAVTRYMLGIRPEFDTLVIDPCIPHHWEGFKVVRVWREATYHIIVRNSDGIEKGVEKLLLNGVEIQGGIPQQEVGTVNEVEAIMGRK